MNPIFQQFFFISPILILVTSIVLNLFVIIFKRNLLCSFLVTISGLIGSIISFYFLKNNPLIYLKYLLNLQSINFFYIFLFFLSSLFSCIFSYFFFKNKKINKEEFYILLLISNIGGYLLFLSTNIFFIFVGIELLSLPLIGIMSYFSSLSSKNLESSFKYFIISSFSLILFLLGLSLIYLSYGTLDIFVLKSLNQISSVSSNNIFLIGIIILYISILIKLSVFPFFSWVPDIYEGSPSFILIYFTNSIMLVMLSIFEKLFSFLPFKNFYFFYSVLVIISIISIFLGNTVAFFQNNFKKLIGYSVISNAGHLIIFLILLHKNYFLNSIIKIYFLGYFLNSLVLFGVITAFSIFSKKQDIYLFEEYEGIFWKYPLLSISMIISLFSTIGVPLTIGFFSKFYLLKYLIENNYFIFCAMIIFGSVLSFCYYLNFIKIFFYKKNCNFLKNIYKKNIFNLSLTLFIFFISLFIIFFGLFPNFLKYLKYF
ncbi:NADH-quinone oxidoreductase subunit N [Buchnera aphidicola]|uniref:NADH-quinone oxidoreductase subunit N n=1 Tax=Buchnera aphidicola TaxID=9 RepID=UPI002093FBF9|nr:proton-conducting transporter membrane subunit [Buchnera aphidicola]USS94586.1 hypothetical protein M5J13_02130 [Buchnera aphidicola (Periphyllus lyropictus)]